MEAESNSATEMEVVVEEPREISVDDVDVGASFGRVAKWTDVGITLETGKVNAVTIVLDAQCQQELQLHLRAVISGQPWSYEFLCGGQGNTEASVLKRGGKGREIDVACVFCGRLCSDTTAARYWFQFSLHDATDEPSFVQMAMGVGATVGENVVLLGRDVLPATSSSLQLDSVGLTSGRSPLKARHIELTSHALAAPIDASATTLCVMRDPSGTDLLTVDQRQAFVAACDAAKRRAERFGGIYHAPDVKQFLDSKVVRMMQRSGGVAEKGFATGFDVTSVDETAKREARRARFNMAMTYDLPTAREISNGASEDDILKRQAELAKRAARAAKFGVDSTNNLIAASAKVLAERVDLDATLDVRDDALHMYSLDDAFTSVRTRDILGYFAGYGPSYVEWINDSSCTVVFDDAFTVSRALLALSTDLPPDATLECQKSTEPANPFLAKGNDEDGMTTEIVQAATGWRLGVPIGAADHMDRQWRLLLRRATLKDFPPEKTWKRTQYQKSAHRRVAQRPPRKRKGRQDDDDDAPATKRRVDDQEME
ncbi:Aste57867_9276 [Aphanomyces stellatus]|uniref:Aste57867_9276 protein n=1 Tax=Aphanomyces stellatus TaxID=120398 RepID=A0A485KMS8_9STRA|nr:hypothetical protein As57867_009240 [Aphanomyces stellatus]VFT86159.1 Aste57867_9276 [Aphanomyces stellatus]